MADAASIVAQADGVDAPTSLASYGESVAGLRPNMFEWAGERCPRSRGRWVNRYSGEWFWDRCGRNRCLVCGPSKAVSVAGAIGVCDPERFIRWSLVADDWQVARARFKRLRYRCREVVPLWQDCYSVERNPEGTGFHAHGYQWGGFIAQRRLQALCLREGFGFPYIRAWHPTSERAYGYALKAATGYGLKGAQRSETLGEFMALNGGRFVHASRDFWREGAKGPRLAGIDAARAVWRERKFGPAVRWDTSEWRLEAA